MQFWKPQQLPDFRHESQYSILKLLSCWLHWSTFKTINYDFFLEHILTKYTLFFIKFILTKAWMNCVLDNNLSCYYCHPDFKLQMLCHVISNCKILLKHEKCLHFKIVFVCIYKTALFIVKKGDVIDKIT